VDTELVSRLTRKAAYKGGKAQGKARDSTKGWHKALVLATQALEEATAAWNLYDEGNLDDSETSGERAAELLAKRSGCACSLVVVNANIGLSFIASEKLLTWRKHTFLTSLQRCYVDEISKARSTTSTDDRDLQRGLVKTQEPKTTSCTFGGITPYCIS